MTIDRLTSYLRQIGGFNILEMTEAPSLEVGKDVKWVHCVAQKMRDA